MFKRKMLNRMFPVFRRLKFIPNKLLNAYFTHVYDEISDVSWHYRTTK